MCETKSTVLCNLPAMGTLPAVTLLTYFTLVSPALASELTVVSWGGAFAKSQRAAYLESFASETGTAIRLAKYDGGLDEIRRQVSSGSLEWDVVDLLYSDNVQACEEGLLEPISPEVLHPATDGTRVEEDFIEGALTECGVAHAIFSTVMAYNRRAFPGEKPSEIADLFDLLRFPGKRALQRKPIANLEWALLSYGVPREELYELLSTERGLRLALARLDQIRDQVIWWTDGQKPVELLESGEVVMASGYNGRFFDAQVNRGAAINIVWDGQLYDYDTWGIVRGTERLQAARDFVRFATETWRMAELSSHIAYGPTRHSAARLVDTHHDSGRNMRLHLPNHPFNFHRAIRKDNEWYARTMDRLSERFQEWLFEDKDLE